MKNFLHRHWRILPPLIVVIALCVAWGCDHDTTPPAASNQSKITIWLLPKTDTITAGSSLSITATMVGWTFDSTVSWSIIGVGVPTGTTQAQLGSLQTNGLITTYIAPATLTANTLSVIVRVRSNQDTLDYADCSITVTTKPVSASHVTILVNPISATLRLGQLQQFQATISGSTNTGVRWKLVSGVGSLSSTGLYSAPSLVTDTSATAIIEAIWLGDSTVIGQASITIASPGPCFRTQIQSIIISNCTLGCHNPVNLVRGFDFTTYQGIMPIVVPGDTATSVLYYRMDHFITLPVNDRVLLTQWILAGVPNSQCNDGMNDCDTTNIHYSTYIQPTIANYCLGCHSYKDAGLCDSLDFTNYPTVATVAQSGLLMDVIRHRYPLPAMPYYGPQLDSCTISKIAAWVNRGAPND